MSSQGGKRKTRRMWCPVWGPEPVWSRLRLKISGESRQSLSSLARMGRKMQSLDIGLYLVWVSNTREERDHTVLRLQEGVPAKAQVKK